MNKTLILGILQLLVVLVSSKNLPSFIKVCKRNDPELNKCCIRVFEELRPYLRKGIPELDLPPGDPLNYIDMSATTGNGESISLQAKSWNQTATGLMDVEIKDMSIDLNTAKATVDLLFPHLRLQGDYGFLGKVLLFTIDTTGPFDINMTDLATKAEIIGKIYTKNDKQHIEFEKVALQLAVKKCNVFFDNLINGNVELSKTLNQAINENIDLIFQELAPFLGDVFGEVARKYYNKVYRMFSIDELFPLD